jgi:hypothetical protein
MIKSGRLWARYEASSANSRQVATERSHDDRGGSLDLHDVDALTDLEGLIGVE